MTVCSTRLSFVLKPRFFSVWLTTSATLFGARAAESTDDLQRFRAGVLAARVAGELHVLFGDRHVALRVFVVVDLRPRAARRLLRSPGCRARGSASSRSSPVLPPRALFIASRSSRRPERLAQVDVLERPVAVVDRDVAVARAAPARSAAGCGTVACASLTIGCAGVSVWTMSLPSSTWRPITFGSPPIEMLIWFR